jgi:hypothetical protein
MHLVEVERRALDVDPELGEAAGLGFGVNFRRVEQGLGGNAAALRQVPPRVARPSAQAVLSPSWAARIAAT